MPKPSPAVAAILPEVSAWLDQLRHPQGGYRYALQAYHPQCGEATAAAVGVLRELGLLDQMTAEERKALTDQLKSYQQDDGSFHDPVLTEEDRISANHPWIKIDDHLAGVCEQALAQLGEGPRLKNTTPPIYDLSGDVQKLIRSLDHQTCPWGRCHNVAFSLLWYRMRHGLIHTSDAQIDMAYRMIEQEMINPVDGMPGAVDHPMDNRLAGYYMLTFAYLPFNRPMPNPEAAIDLIIAATDDAGCIGDKGLCHIFDAIYSLNVVGRQLNWQYRFEEASQAASRVAEFLLREHRKPDGGFSYDTDRSPRHQNFIRANPGIPQSDLQGTLMSLACLNIIDRFRQRMWHEDYLNPWVQRLSTQAG